ncbi:MAG: trypsin-like peptidase domain-containing protein, partial [Alloalcanivorax venustensis]
MAEAKDVTFKILAFDESGEAISTGSAFKVGDDIVSAAHVLIGADSVEIYDSHGDVVASTETVLQVDNLKDIVILDVDVDGYEGLEVERGPISVGSDIWAVGAPMGLDGTVSKGVVSSVREDEVGRRPQFTAPVSPGSSGGPVLNSQGRFVGMTIETVREGQNLNFAISADHIVALANQTPSVEKIGDIQSVPEDDDVRVFVDMATGFANAENIEYGDLVSGSLEDGDYEIDGFWDFYMFRGEEGDIVEIILSSQGHKVRGSLIVGSTIFSDNTAGLDGEFVGNKNIVYTKLPGDDEYYFIVAGDKDGKIDYQFHL